MRFLLTFSLVMVIMGGGVLADMSKPDTAANFRLFDHLGSSYELHRQFLKPAVVLSAIQPNCELSKEQLPYLQGLADEFKGQEVVFFLIDPSQGVDRAAVSSYAADLGIGIPVLLDDSQMAAKTLGLTHAGETLLVDTSDWRIVYRGVARDGEVESLKDAIAALLAGGDVPEAQIIAQGKAIPYAPVHEGLTYVHDIAPILEERCVQCHRKGDIAPFDMSSYAKVKNYAAMIREVTLAKRMPPWHADPHVASYANDQSLRPDELVKLATWIDSGAPRGEGADPLAPYGENKADEWRHGEPDMVVTMGKVIDIPAQGIIPYVNDFVKVKLDGDKWLRAVEVLPGNRTVVHHALIFLRYPEHLKHIEPEWGGGTGGYFAAFGPGYEALEFPEGTAKFIPDGASIHFQMHYTVTGKPETDQTRIGLYYYDGEPEREFITHGASNFAIKIPPRVEDEEFQSLYYVRKPVEIWSMAPHMHYRGSRFSYVAEYPDGTKETLLNVPFFDFNWQREYRLPEPKVLPAGTTIRCTAGYNNSVTNPNNPDPEDTVKWGNQSWEEMLIGHMSFAFYDKSDVNAPPVEYAKSMGETITEENLIGTEWRWDKYRVYFLEPGKALVNDSMVTDWEMDGTILYVALGDRRKFPVYVQGDKLNLLGRTLEYIGRF